ncbi:hypothetical protein JCM3774_001160 [Rhodotorula dairenensis]
MSTTLRTAPSWLGSLAHSSPLIDTRFQTFTANTSSPRSKSTAASKLFDDTYRGRRGSDRGSLDDELGDIEGIGLAKDGAWSITISRVTKLRARKADAQVTVYVTTPTANLTLLRTPSEILELHSRLVEAFPDPTSDAQPASQRLSPKKKRSVLASLTRTLSPRRNGSVAASRGVDARHPSTSPASESLGGIADALTAYSRSASVREHAAWARFFATRREDLHSARIERRIKRYRSDQTLEVSRKPNVDPFSAATPTQAGLTSRPRRESSTRATVDSVVDSHPLSLELDAQFARDVEALLAGHADDETCDMPSVSQMDLSPRPDPAAKLAVERDAPTLEHRPVTADEDIDIPTLVVHQAPAHLDGDEGDQDAVARFDSQTASDALPASVASLDSKNEVETVSHAPGTSSRHVLVIGAEAQEPPVAPTPPDCGSSGMTRSASGYSTATSNTLEKRSRSITLDSFERLRVLGKGCAGKVLLVREKRSGQLMALKAITKRHVLAHRELAHTRTEQSVLKACARDSLNPFIVKLHYSFHDKETLYLALDFHPGGDLATQLARWGRLGRDRARFYICEIIEGVEGLHRAGVIYRDLKPENVLISATGHCVLTDFGLSKDFGHDRRARGSEIAGLPPHPHRPQQAARSVSTPPSPSWLLDGRETTLSFCGTAEYLAPEVLLGEPYSYEVDIYSAGTMLYEMLAGVTPFYATDHASMYRRVLHDELSFELAAGEFDPNTRTLLRGMLQRDPLIRITIPRLKRMPYFDSISWDLILNQRYMPPFVPQLDPQDPTDTSWFDDAYLSMPAEVKGSDPEDDPGGGRETPAGDAQPAFDESGKDVFDGYSFYGRDSASIHEDELDHAQDSDALQATTETGLHTEETDLDADTSPPPDDDDADAPEEALAEGEPELARPTESVSLRSEPESPAGLAGAEGGEAQPEASIAVTVAQADSHRTEAEKESECVRPNVRLQRATESEQHDAPVPLVEEQEPDSDSEWISLAADPARTSVKNGGREATLWQRGFRDKYRMAIAPLASPLRPPRASKRRQDPRGGSVSSSGMSSVRASPATTPEPPSSPRPMSVIRRLTSPRPSLGGGTLRARKSQRSLGTAASVATSKSSTAPSLAPPGATTTDCSASIGKPSY